MNIVCTVDILTRHIALPAGVQIASYDHNVDVIQFNIEPIEDFSLNTSSIRIAAQGPNKARHDYAVDPSTVQIEEETGYITFDWPIPAGATEMPIGSGFKYGDKGQLIFAVCAEIIDGSTVSKAWHSDDGIITVVAHLEPESGGGEDPEEEATNAQKISQLQTDVAVINTQVGALANGSPTPVATVAEMTDESAVYLYTGSETGYTAGNWYYYNGTAWTSGGVYGGAVTDPTLSVSGAPADAKAAGDEISELKEDLNIVSNVIFPHENTLLTEKTDELPSGTAIFWDTTVLKKGNSYRIFLSFTANPTNLSALKTATSASGSAVVDTITSLFDGDSWTDGKTALYTPQVDGIKKIQIQLNSAYSGGLSATLKVYDYTKETTPITADIESEISAKQAAIYALKYEINLDDDYNLLPPDGYEVGKYISVNGTITSHATLVLSDYIPIDPAQGYICNWTKTATIVSGDASLTGNINTFDRLQFCFFDADKNVIPFTGSTSTVSKAIPENAKYIRVTILNESVYPYARLIYGNYSAQPIVRIVDYKKTQQSIYDSPNTGFEGFDMVMFGDSITHGSLSVSNDGTSYVDYANDVLRSKILNVGFGGTRMTYTLSGAGLFCFYHLCECITSSDTTLWDDLVAYATDENTTYLPHLQKLMAVDWTKVKAVGLMYGANDYTSNTPVGNAYSEDTTKFDGACAYGLKLLLTKYPHLQVLILTPFDREMTAGDASTMTDRQANTAGLLMSDYADSLEHVVSRFHCPLIKTGELFGINQYNILLYAPDGTHPRSNIAQKRLGWLFAQTVKTHLAPFNG